jgi:hypothetical protein
MPQSYNLELSPESSALQTVSSGAGIVGGTTGSKGPTPKTQKKPPATTTVEVIINAEVRSPDGFPSTAFLITWMIGASALLIASNTVSEKLKSTSVSRIRDEQTDAAKC